MKIIGSDYDGTLNHGGIDDSKRAAISRWRKAGNIFALVSGRNLDDIHRIRSEAKFECDYYLANNGAVIFSSDGEVISDIRCDGILAKPLISFLFENGCTWVNIQTDFSCKVFKDEKDCCSPGFYTIENMPEITYFNQMNTQLPNVQESALVTNGIRKNFGEALNPLQNGDCIDIVNININKARGLYILAELTGVRSEDIIAVGDNINDRDMIAEFRSYAMENGVEEIKQLADYVSPGITELIEKEMEYCYDNEA